MFNVAILCLSDKGFIGERKDESTLVMESILLENNFTVSEKIILPDDFQLIKEKLIEVSNKSYIHLILTTGGTGLSPRDVTPEATAVILEKNIPGIPEAIRNYSMTITNRAMLSRGVAGIRNNTLILNLPGSPKAVKETLEFVISPLIHGLETMTGNVWECARK